MKIGLSDAEISLLEQKNVSFSASKEYSEDEALDLLDVIREIEVSYDPGGDDLCRSTKKLLQSALVNGIITVNRETFARNT